MAAIFFSLAIAMIFFSGVQAATFTITNNCACTIWPGTVTDGAMPQLSSTGFELGPGAAQTLNVPAGWYGSLWARTGCSTTGGKFLCDTGDCGSGHVECAGAGSISPATLVQLTVARNDSSQDFYDINIVDGFNLPVALTPQGGTGVCQRASCPANINTVCPPELAVKRTDGVVVACKSACMAFKQPRYCCTRDFRRPDKCPRTKYSKIFKSQCPQAYSFVDDDKSSTFTCSGGANYAITFCP